MLNIYVTDRPEDIPKNLELIRDVEAKFKELELIGTDLDKYLIEKIDKGMYLDKNFFIDRFGAKLYIDYLSTGCKAALCVANYPNSIIDTRECGTNALDYIVNNCTDGNILTSEPFLVFRDLGKEVNLSLDSNHFNHVKDLTSYVLNDRERRMLNEINK